MKRLKGLSLFSGVGLAEVFLKDVDVDIILANEIDKQRGDFFQHIFKNTKMIVGDITDDKIRDDIIFQSISKKVDFIIATPPCQGMSIAGKMDKFDVRNQLIFYAIDVIKKVRPRFVLIENVPRQLKTTIMINGKKVLIPEYIRNELSEFYYLNEETLIKAMDFGVPQMRQRNITLLSRKDTKIKWSFPEKNKNQITLKEALKGVPSLYPLLREGVEMTLKKFPQFLEYKQRGLVVSEWHFPPTHSWKMVEWMMHTPSGKTAFDNKLYYPQKNDGTRIKGHYNHYRRHNWDKPSRTITQNNGVISSLTCVHPGNLISNDGTEKGRLYSDPRVFSIYELLIISSLPPNWDIPAWAEESFIRKVIGEGIPPLLIKLIVKELTKQIKK